MCDACMDTLLEELGEEEAESARLRRRLATLEGANGRAESYKKRSDRTLARIDAAKAVMAEHLQGLTFNGRWPERIDQCHCLACDVYRALTTGP